MPPSGMAPTAVQFVTHTLPARHGMAWQQGQGYAVLTSGEGLMCFPSQN